MGSPLGDFIRARRDATSPADVGLPAGSRRRAPGLRRAELAGLAGISVEYLIRIEQGRDRNPSASVVNALADAMRFEPVERDHLRHVTKVTGGTCVGARAQAGTTVRPNARRLLDALEPEAAAIVNRLGELLAFTDGFELVARPIGLLDSARPSLTRYVFTDPRARATFTDWATVADEQAFALSCSPADGAAQALRDELAAVAGAEFTGRVDRHALPVSGPMCWMLPRVGELRWGREVLELAPTDSQQLVVFFPADEATADAVGGLRRASSAGLRAVT